MIDFSRVKAVCEMLGFDYHYLSYWLAIVNDDGAKICLLDRYEFYNVAFFTEFTLLDNDEKAAFLKAIVKDYEEGLNG